MTTEESADLVKWRVLYDYRTCPGSLLTTIERAEVIIEAPRDREAAKKVAIAYLNGLNNGADGRGLFLVE